MPKYGKKLESIVKSDSSPTRTRIRNRSLGLESIVKSDSSPTITRETQNRFVLESIVKSDSSPTYPWVSVASEIA